MAENVRGINVVIGADTTKLGRALADVEAKSKSIQSELRQIDRLLKFDPNNTTLLAQKQQLLSEEIENTREKLDRLKSAQQQVNDQFLRGEISAAQYRAFQREIEKTEGQLRILQNRLEETNRVIDNQSSAWSRLQERLNVVGQRLQEVGSRIGRTTTSIGTIAAAITPAIASVTGGVMALGSSFAAAGAGAVAFGAVAAGALSNVFEAAEEVQKIEEKIANADSLREKIEAQKELAKLYEGMSESQRNALRELQSFKGFWSDFTKQFETPVFQAFANVLNGTKTLLQKLEPTIKSVANVVVELTNEFNQALQGSAMKSFFEWLETHAAESLYNFLHIFGNVSMGMINLFKAFSPLGASMEERLVRLTERFKGWSAKLENSAGFEQFVNYVRENGPMIMTIFGNLGKTVGVILTELAPLGAILMKLAAGVSEFILSVASSVAGFIDYQKIVSATFTAIQTVVLQVFGVIRDFIMDKVSEIQTFWQQNGEQIRQAAEKVFTFIQNIVSITMPVVLMIIKSVWNSIKGIISGVIDTILGVIKTFSSVLNGDWRGAWEGIKQILIGVVEVIWNYLNLMFIGRILGGIKTLAVNALGTVKSMWDNILVTFKGIGDNVANVTNNLFSKVSSIFSNMRTTISEKMTATKDSIIEIWKKAEDFLKNIDLKQIGKDIIQGLINGISMMANALFEKARSIADSIKSTIKNALDINSPSRVMRDEVGKWIPIGLAEGIEKNINAVVSATNRMAQAAVPNVNASSFAGASTPTTINIPKTAGAKIEQHFHFHTTAPTPSEVARKNLQVSRQLAMEWGL